MWSSEERSPSEHNWCRLKHLYPLRKKFYEICTSGLVARPARMLLWHHPL